MLSNFDKKLLISIITFFIIICGFCINDALSFSREKQIQQTQQLAILTPVDGIYVYILSVPNIEYERIGTVEKHFAMTGSNIEMIKALVAKAKKEFSQCQAIIFTGYIFDKCEVIKFKN